MLSIILSTVFATTTYGSHGSYSSPEAYFSPATLEQKKDRLNARRAQIEDLRAQAALSQATAKEKQDAVFAAEEELKRKELKLERFEALSAMYAAKMEELKGIMAQIAGANQSSVQAAVHDVQVAEAEHNVATGGTPSAEIPQEGPAPIVEAAPAPAPVVAATEQPAAAGALPVVEEAAASTTTSTVVEPQQAAAAGEPAGISSSSEQPIAAGKTTAAGEEVAVLAPAVGG